MQDLLNDIGRRFPLLNSLKLSSGEGPIEKLPPFMGLLLAAIEQRRHSAFCFVFPRKDKIAPLVAVLYSLGRFAIEFPTLAEEYARRVFTKGQRVKVLPDGDIFGFGGLWESDASHFRLEILNHPSGAAFNWPTSEILRLEATHRKIPRGKLTDMHRLRDSAKLSDLDRLIGTRTFGNGSLFRNHVFFLGGRADFDEFLQSTNLTANSGIASLLANLVSVGSISESGAVEHADVYNVQGEPFIACSSRIENIAAACASALARSKIVIVDGPSRITDLGKFDQITETQNLIILADDRDEDKLRQLYDRRCKFWRLTLADLQIGEANNKGHFFAPLFRAAENSASFHTEIAPCENVHLEKVSVALEACECALDESEGDETRRLLGSIYSVLMRCAGMLQPPSPEEREILQKAVSKLSLEAAERIMWLSDDAAMPLTEACKALKTAVEDISLGNMKGEAVATAILAFQEREISRLALVARTAAQQAAATGWLEQRGLNYPVLLPGSAGDSGFFRTLICIAWPNAVNFERVISQHAAPTVNVVAYPFERRWLGQFEQRRAHAQRVPNLDASAKSHLVGFPSDLSVHWPEPPKPPTHKPPDTSMEPNEFKIWNFEEKIIRKGISRPAAVGEEMVPTKLVTFIGDSYAFLTESCKLPVITELLSDTIREGYAIPRRQLEAIRMDDVLVFREGGRRDVIHALADSRLGVKAAEIRLLAARWQRALRESGLSEIALRNALANVGCNRSQGVVRYWLHDDSMIGPQNEVDITSIAQATGDDDLLRDTPRVWSAIRLLRGEHQSAGMRLLHVLLRELPGRLGELREGRTHIEIENTIGAWIVQVENIAEQAESRPRSQINTLLWDEDELS